MAYLAVANFRTGTLAEYCVGLDLTTTEASDTALAAAILRMSARFDILTNDHFEAASPVTLTLSGNDSRRLELSRRCTAVSSVAIVNYLGTSTTQAITTYRLHSSLDSTGAAIRSPGATDWVEIVPYSFLTGASYGVGDCWPSEINSVVVTGAFGWVVTPSDVKRAIAMMVANEFKPEADVFQRATQISDAGTIYQLDQGETGLPPVDRIIAAYRYAPAAGSAAGSGVVMIG